MIFLNSECFIVTVVNIEKKKSIKTVFAMVFRAVVTNQIIVKTAIRYVTDRPDTINRGYNANRSRLSKTLALVPFTRQANGNVNMTLEFHSLCVWTVDVYWCNVLCCNVMGSVVGATRRVEICDDWRQTRAQKYQFTFTTLRRLQPAQLRTLKAKRTWFMFDWNNSICHRVWQLNR